MAGSNTGGATFQSWLSPGPSNAPGITPGSVVGSMPPQPWVRSVLDARRMMYRSTPNAEYPAGYLGTITSRRGDRVLDGLKARVNQRSYQRGVHLGERIDPGDYLFPEGFDPLDGIRRQATTGERYRPALEFFQPTPTIDGQMAPRGSESILTIDQHRAASLAMLRPKFGLPSKRQQSMVG
jgi:hypothetical protein